MIFRRNRMAGLPWSHRGFHEYSCHRDSIDVIGSRSNVRVGADTGHFSIRYVTTDMVKDCLKSALVAEVNLSKMTKQVNPVSLLFASFQSDFPFATLVVCRGTYPIGP